MKVYIGLYLCCQLYINLLKKKLNKIILKLKIVKLQYNILIKKVLICIQLF